MIKVDLPLNLNELQLQLFSCKNISQIASEIFATVFSLITRITKPKIKQLVERPKPILPNYAHING